MPRVRPGPIVPGLSWVIPACSVCGNDSEQYPSGDFAPYVTIFLVLHLMVPILFAADRTWDRSVGLQDDIGPPAFLDSCASSVAVCRGRGDQLCGSPWDYPQSGARIS